MGLPPGDPAVLALCDLLRLPHWGVGCWRRASGLVRQRSSPLGGPELPILRFRNPTFGTGIVRSPTFGIGIVRTVTSRGFTSHSAFVRGTTSRGATFHDAIVWPFPRRGEYRAETEPIGTVLVGANGQWIPLAGSFVATYSDVPLTSSHVDWKWGNILRTEPHRGPGSAFLARGSHAPQPFGRARRRAEHNYLAHQHFGRPRHFTTGTTGAAFAGLEHGSGP